MPQLWPISFTKGVPRDIWPLKETSRITSWIEKHCSAVSNVHIPGMDNWIAGYLSHGPRAMDPSPQLPQVSTAGSKDQESSDTGVGCTDKSLDSVQAKLCLSSN